MNERLLQYIWQFQYFDKNKLETTSGEPLQILLAGKMNLHQGPDFSDARIKLGDTTWAGNIEVHIKSSDWKKHGHTNDPHYDNVILHVVWEDDKPDQNLPVLILQDRISLHVIDRYEKMMQADGFIPCQQHIHEVKPLVWQGWKERLLAERLIRKSAIVEEHLKNTEKYWEEVFWWMLAYNFGLKKNAEAFEAIAKTLPVVLLAKYKHSIHQVEALLFGQAGLLEKKFSEDYPRMLQKEYRFLQKKHGLKPINHPLYFLRMRPAGFPTLRLANLAVLITESAHLFSVIKESEDLNAVTKLFQQTANDYWHYHYRFDEPGEYHEKKTGKTMIDNIVINTLSPVLFAYGSFHKEEKYKQKALQWLEATSSEKNAITKGYENLGIANKTAFDSQALIELKTQYCDEKRCLACSVGNAILKNK